MSRTATVVHYLDWDILLKCKNPCGTEDDVLKSIWTEEYGNPIKEYNTKGMIRIMSQVIEELVPEQKRAYLLDRLLRAGWLDEKTLLHELFVYVQLLNVREQKFGLHLDLYIIERRGFYYTIAGYDKLKESKTNG